MMMIMMLIRGERLVHTMMKMKMMTKTAEDADDDLDDGNNDADDDDDVARRVLKIMLKMLTMTDADDFVDDANDDTDDADAYVLVLRWRKPQLSKWPWRLHLVSTFSFFISWLNLYSRLFSLLNIRREVRGKCPPPPAQML